MTESPEARRAFNLGCNARIAGRARSDNPYGSTEEPPLYRLWHQGWEHCDSEWGRQNPPARQLPRPIASRRVT